MLYIMIKTSLFFHCNVIIKSVVNLFKIKELFLTVIWYKYGGLLCSEWWGDLRNNCLFYRLFNRIWGYITNEQPLSMLLMFSHLIKYANNENYSPKIHILFPTPLNIVSQINRWNPLSSSISALSILTFVAAG